MPHTTEGSVKRAYVNLDWKKNCLSHVKLSESSVKEARLSPSNRRKMTSFAWATESSSHQGRLPGGGRAATVSKGIQREKANMERIVYVGGDGNT